MRTSRGRWVLLASLWAAVLVLGTGGFLQQAADAGLHRSWLDGLHLSLELQALNYQGGDHALNWRLEIARFAAPMITAGTILQTTSVLFRDQFDRLRLRFARGHSIVCGLGDAGSRLAVSLTEAGRRVVAIEIDDGAPGVGLARGHGVTVLVGDAAEPSMLDAARAGRASLLVAAAGTDATNVQVAAVARAVRRPTNRPALRAAVHLTDADLCALLRAGDLDARGAARVSFFNLHEVAARAWVSDHPPFGDASRRAHPMVLGLGRLGRSLVVAIGQRWAETGDGQPLSMTLVDRAATGRWEALRLRHPALTDVCVPTLLDLDLEAPSGAAVDAFTSTLRSHSPTSVAVTFGDESLAMSSALFAHHALREQSVPVVMRTRTDRALGALLSPVGGGGRSPFPGVTIFPFLDRTCVPATVEDAVREQLARAVHEDYLAHAGDGSGLRRSWLELDDDERDPSRRRVDAILEDLEVIGCDLVPLRSWGAPTVTFTAAEVERLAAREHERWRADRTASGWTHGPTRDDRAKRNPLLVGWSELPDEARTMNLDAARALPAMLARAGFEPVRLQ